MFKTQMIKMFACLGFGKFGFCHPPQQPAAVDGDLFRIWCFGFRICTTGIL
jgi:hypothetical protein